jgi:hypothetical protein
LIEEKLYKQALKFFKRKQTNTNRRKMKLNLILLLIFSLLFTFLQSMDANQDNGFKKAISRATVFQKFLPYLDSKSALKIYFLFLFQFKNKILIDTHFESENIFGVDQSSPLLLTYFGNRLARCYEQKFLVSDLNRNQHNLAKTSLLLSRLPAEPCHKLLFKSSLEVCDEFQRLGARCFDEKDKKNSFTLFDEKTKSFFLGTVVENRLQKIAVGSHPSVSSRYGLIKVLDAVNNFTAQEKNYYTLVVLKTEILEKLFGWLRNDKDGDMTPMVAFATIFSISILWFSSTTVLGLPTIPYLSLIFPSSPFSHFIEQCASFTTLPTLVVFVDLITTPYVSKHYFLNFKASESVSNSQVTPRYLKYTIPLLEQRKATNYHYGALEWHQFVEEYFQSVFFTLIASFPVLFFLLLKYLLGY